MKALAAKIAGVFFILLGIVGLFLPVLQGWLLIFIGLSLLSPALAARVRRTVYLRISSPPVVTLDEWKRRGACAGFTTRRFPARPASTDDLVREDVRAAVRTIASGPQRWAFLKQVHGGHGFCVERGNFGSGDFWRAGEGDFLVTAAPRTALLVLTADCLPVFYAAMKDGKAIAVALAHAGWRGTRDRVAVQALERLKVCAGVDGRDVQVAFGPSIDAKHYEVGEEFRTLFPRTARTSGGKTVFDLRRENRDQLAAAGVPEKNVIDTGLSTAVHNRLFYSFRLEGQSAGRSVSFIYLP